MPRGARSSQRRSTRSRRPPAARLTAGRAQTPEKPPQAAGSRNGPAELALQKAVLFHLETERVSSESQRDRALLGWYLRLLLRPELSLKACTVI